MRHRFFSTTYLRSSLLASCLWTLSCTPTPKDEVVVIRHEVSEVPAKLVGAAPSGPAIEYTVSFDNAAQHYISVRAIYPSAADSDVDLMLAVWTPGSYLVREYARHIEDLRVVDASGAELSARKTTKNRWTVHTGKTEGIVVEYKLYCRELSVRTNFVDADSAILNGAPTFLTMADGKPREHIVRLKLPEGFKVAISGLESPADNEFHASSYDELVDSPILAGRNLEIGEFTIEKVKHRLAHLGDSSQWDLQEALSDVEVLARAEIRFWQVLPYDHYDFLNVILGGGGGLEHLDSTLMLARPLGSRKSEDYKRWLGLVAHEFFHTWNVKRLRPKNLGPFDYEKENHTKSLWVAEGITSYYDDLLMRRAGLLSETEYLKRLSGQIKGLQTTEGRHVQSLSSASYNAWIKYYRRDENSGNTAISYYTKGAVVAFLLDVEIRKASSGAKSLDHLMRALYEKYAGETGYTPEEFRALASEIAGTDLSEFFAMAIDSTTELDYSGAEDYFGLKLTRPGQDEPTQDDKDDDAEEEEKEVPGWLGLSVANSVITKLTRKTPGYEAGLNVGDEIIALDGYRSRDLSKRLESYEPGQKVTITISRNGKLREMEATLGKKPDEAWKLAVRPARSGAQSGRANNWLSEYKDL